jgi:DNA polymerase
LQRDEINAVRASDEERGWDLDDVRREAAGCRLCPLWQTATQIVFGDGPSNARLMFIGEAPGHHEDLHGIPFVGPAGRLFDEALVQAGIPRTEVFVTNIVKHRPWVADGNQKKNRPPKQSEIKACRPWLVQEIALVRPSIICCIGAPAARQILGKDFRLTEQRGQWFSTDAAPAVIATIHPAYVLIQPEPFFDRWREALFADFRQIAQRCHELSAAA